MIADEHRRVKILFKAAKRRPAEQRSAYLDRACGGDTALRAEVESLLACDAPTGAREGGCSTPARGGWPTASAICSRHRGGRALGMPTRPWSAGPSDDTGSCG